MRKLESGINDTVSFNSLFRFYPQAFIRGKQEDLRDKVIVCLSCISKTFIEALAVSCIQETTFYLRFALNSNSQMELEHVIPDTREAVSHQLHESADIRADAFIPTAALFQSAFPFGRIQRITASVYKGFIWEPGVSSVLSLNQSDKIL